MTYREQDFEEHIEKHLLESGYRQGKPHDYDKDLCLIPDEVIAFIKDTQCKEYEKLQKQYGADTDNKLLQRLSNEIYRYGSLEILRKGFKDRGCRFHLAFFQPSSGMNVEHQKLYQKNRFTVIRQFIYSKTNANEIDLVIALNGLPIITLELKNSLTGQFVNDAVKQYKRDRDPAASFFRFKRCLVHFAVGNEKIYMTTRLAGENTFFLPFNKDTENPINPNGHKTAYLWEDILQPNTLLDLITNFLHIEKKTTKTFDKERGLQETSTETFIFPRFHQLDAVRKLLAAVRANGVGTNYLIQHSAGSGKSNSIAWLAHQLAKFYRHVEDKDRLFDSIIVVTDRRLLDQQLQHTIKQFEQTAGVVNPINLDSQQLKRALESDKDIIITTLQKFPVISESISELKGKRFAVIVDEAHTSQTGEASNHLKKALSVNFEDAENEDHDDFDLEDEIVKEIRSRGKQNHISYFAFTATPKNKTLELFGTKNGLGGYDAFHVYSMRQAIEEGFILDVLENYTTFKRYFKLAKKIEGDSEYEKSKALRLLTSYVDLQPHAIEMKTRLMLDHFLEKTIKAIQGTARGMLVTRSRLHAVRFYLMFCKVMREKNLTFRPLVAFSGTVKDPDSGEEYTENGLNQLGPRVSIPDAFKTPAFRLLVVADKFQTGFDEPLLHTMYVDKKLGGVNAVQTLSRLNRTTKYKLETIVLDFVNEAKGIQESFQPYYQTVLLEKGTDPNKLYDLQIELDSYEVYTDQNVDDFAKVFYDKQADMKLLQPILDEVVMIWKFKCKTSREDFKSKLQSFIRLYGFVSQFISFEDLDLEKLFVFAKNLNKKIPKEAKRMPSGLEETVDLDSFRIQKTFEDGIELEREDGKLTGQQSGKPRHSTEEMDLLSNIIKVLNDTYGLELTEEDKVDFENIKNRVNQHEELNEVMDGNNTEVNIRYKFDKIVDDILLEFVHTKLELYKKLSDPKVNPLFKSKLFEGYQKEYSQRSTFS